MKKKLLAILLAVVMAAGLLPGTAFAAGIGLTQAQNAKISLSLQYTMAGSATQWYAEPTRRARPVVTDLDGDGKLEVLTAGYSLNVVDAATGETKWQISGGRDRSTDYDIWVNSGLVYCDFTVLDIDGDSKKEIVIGYGSGMVAVLNDQGYFKWHKQPTTAEIRSLAVADLDKDGKYEIIVGAGVGSETTESVWVYRCDGTLAPNWPQIQKNSTQNGYNYGLGTEEDLTHLSTTAYSNGVYGNGITTGDIDGDGYPEIIVPTDNQYINAYNYNGTLVEASASVYGDQHGGRMWGKIPLYEDYGEEIAHKNEGWGGAEPEDLDTRAEKYRAELGAAGTTYADVDGDGTYELVVTALMVDRTTHTLLGNGKQTINDSKYMTAFILNGDRTRYVNEELGFDWTSAPNELTSTVRGALRTVPAGSMNAELYPVPVCADLDGDGYQEILFNSYDGRVHCFSLDKSEWYYALPKSTSTAFEYATPVVCRDLDGDGTKEVIFASWIDSDTSPAGIKGALYVLSCEGKLLAKTDLPDAYNAGLDTGVMAAPAVEDIDGDGKYEILLNTRYAALCAYKVTVNQPGVPAVCGFTDVKLDRYYTEAVAWAVTEGITNGTSDTTFTPGRTCTHIEILTFLWRAVGRPISAVEAPVEAGSGSPDFRLAVNWAWEKGMIDETFQRKADCTRSDAVMYIWQAKDSVPPTGPSSFTDVSAGERYADAVAWAEENGVSDGDGGTTFGPSTICTRGNIVTLLRRAFVPGASLNG